MFEIVADQDSVLANKLASYFDKKIIRPEIKTFADTECVAKIADASQISEKTILVVQQFFFFHKNLSGGNTINNQLLQFLLLIDLVKKMGAKKIIALLPYLPYSRQDKSFGGKYDGAAGLMGKFLKSAGVDDVISLDLHASEIKRGFAVKLNEVSLENFWVEFLKNSTSDLFGEREYCIISPDEGRAEKNKKIAHALGVPFAYIKKERVAPDHSVALSLSGNVKNKIVIVIDDIVDTARTATNTCQLLEKHGAKKVYGCFTHAVMSKGAIEKLERSCFDKVFVTDTVQLKGDVLSSKKVAVLSIGDLLCEIVKERLNYAKLFDKKH